MTSDRDPIDDESPTSLRMMSNTSIFANDYTLRDPDTAILFCDRVGGH